MLHFSFVCAKLFPITTKWRPHPPPAQVPGATWAPPGTRAARHPPFFAFMLRTMQRPGMSRRVLEVSAVCVAARGGRCNLQPSLTLVMSKEPCSPHTLPVTVRHKGRRDDELASPLFSRHGAHRLRQGELLGRFLLCSQTDV